MVRLLKFIFFFLVALIVAGWMMLHTDFIQHKLKERLKNSFLTATGMDLDVRKISIRYRSFAFDEITLKDEKNQIFLKADHAFLQFSDLSAFFNLETAVQDNHLLSSTAVSRFKNTIPKIHLSIEQAKVYAIPTSFFSNPNLFQKEGEKKDSVSTFAFPECELSFDTIQIDSHLIPLPSSLTFDALLLKNFKLHSSPEGVEIGGEGSFQGYALEKPLRATFNYSLMNDRAFQMNYHVLFNQNTAFNGVLQLSPSLMLDGTTLHLSSFSLKDLMALSQGTIQADFLLSGDLTSPLIEGVVKSDVLKIEGQEIKKLKAHILCQITEKEAKGEWELTAGFEDRGNGTLSAVFYWPYENLLEIQNLEWQTPFTKGQGSFLISPQNFGITGKATGSFEDLPFLERDTLSFLGAPVFYDMNFSYEKEEGQSVQAELFCSLLKINELEISDTVLKIRGKNLLSSPSGNLDLIGTNLVYNGFESKKIHFEGELNPAFDPFLQGTLEIANGTYEIPVIGVSLKDVQAHLNVKGPQLEIKEITAHDGKTGKISGSGFFLVDPIQQSPFELNLTLDETLLVNLDDLQITCNGPLTFKGNNLEGSLTGQMEVSNAVMTTPDTSQTAIHTVDVTYINIPPATPISSVQNSSTPPWPLELSILFNFPKTLTIEGRDLSSKWKGEIAIKGTGISPLYFGELRIVEGEYLFNGNPFSLNQGSLLFDGEFSKKTTMYVIASKDLDRVKVDVIAKGPIKNPAVSFRSNPPLSQREILSWILFNRGTAEISPFQGAQLSESISNLSTGHQGPDVLSKIRSILKIDRLEFGQNSQSDNHGVKVQVGKYISDNILISVIKSDVNQLAIEANLTDQIKFQAQIGDDSEGQLLLKWKKDY